MKPLRPQLAIFLARNSQHFRLLEVVAILLLAVAGALEYANLRVIDRARMHYLAAFVPAERDYYQYVRSQSDSLKPLQQTKVLKGGLFDYVESLRTQEGARRAYVTSHNFWQALKLQKRLVAEIVETRRLASSLSQQHLRRLTAIYNEIDSMAAGVLQDLDKLVPYANGKPFEEPVYFKAVDKWVKAIESFQGKLNAEEAWLLKDIEAQRNRWTQLLYAALFAGTILMISSKTLNWAREANKFSR